MNKERNKTLNAVNKILFNKNIVKEVEYKKEGKDKWNIIPYIDNLKYNNTFYINNVKRKKNLGKSCFLSFLSNLVKLEKVKGGKGQVFIVEKIDK